MNAVMWRRLGVHSGALIFLADEGCKSWCSFSPDDFGKMISLLTKFETEVLKPLIGVLLSRKPLDFDSLVYRGENGSVPILHNSFV